MPDRSTPKSAPPASASDNPAPEDLPPMGRPSLDDFLAASEPAAPDHARMDDLPPLGRPSLEDFPDAPDDRSASGDPAAGKNGRVRDEARPPGTRAQKIRTAIIAVFLVFLAYMCWPVGPRDEILMARLPAEYRIAAEARGALDLLTLFERAELADRFWGGSLGGRLARVDLDAEGDRDADAEDASLPARSPYTAWRDGVRQVSDFFASPGGTRFMGSGLNGSIMAAATDPSLDDAVLVVHSVRLARAWFAWKADRKSVV